MPSLVKVKVRVRGWVVAKVAEAVAARASAEKAVADKARNVVVIADQKSVYGQP